MSDDKPHNVLCFQIDLTSLEDTFTDSLHKDALTMRDRRLP